MAQHFFIQKTAVVKFVCKETQKNNSLNYSLRTVSLLTLLAVFYNLEKKLLHIFQSSDLFQYDFTITQSCFSLFLY